MGVTLNKITKSVLDYYKRTDKIMFLLCISCTVYSVVVLYSIAVYFQAPGDMRQVVIQVAASLLGIVAAVVVSKIDYHTMASLWKYHVAITWFLVLLTFFLGTNSDSTLNNVQIWLRIPVIGINLQPSELAKLSFILTFAYHITNLKGDINDLRNIVLLCIHGAIPVLIIHFQGDDGSALVFAAIFVAMMFVAGLNWRFFAFAAGALVVGFPLAWMFVLSDYQKNRIMLTFTPEKDMMNQGFQAYQGKVSLGSGGVTGKGLFTGIHREIPEKHNDFIFAYIGEALGLIGCLIVIALLVAICIRILRTGAMATDLLGQLICVGIFTIFVCQIVLNLGMCLNLMPVIGVTLPFLSYGGSSAVTMYLSIGMVLSVYIQNNALIFQE